MEQKTVLLQDIDLKSPEINPVIEIFGLKGYNFDSKESQHEKDRSVPDRLLRMRVMYQKLGVRRSVEAVLLVHQHGHPHVLLLQIGNNVKGFFKLPGGRCRPGESDLDCMRRKLSHRLAPRGQTIEWKIGFCLSVWYRPNFETMLYPYLPAHIKKPKECKKLFVIFLPDKCFFSIPKNFNFIAVPLFELYDKQKRYGPIISSIPQQLSRYKLLIM